MIDQLWSGMLLFLGASASNAGRQIWMKIIYIVLHSLNSICKTSLVDMKLAVSVVLEWWSSIGRNLATVLRSITVFWYSPTLPEIIIFCFFTMVHVSGSFFMVELQYLEANVILCHTLVTNGMRLIRVAKGGFLSHLTLTFLKPSSKRKWGEIIAESFHGNISTHWIIDPGYKIGFIILFG